jgi:hypothetical protein
MLFQDIARNRSVHLGPYPLEALPRDASQTAIDMRRPLAKHAPLDDTSSELGAVAAVAPGTDNFPQEQLVNVGWAMAFLADLDEALDHLESDTRHMIEKQKERVVAEQLLKAIMVRLEAGQKPTKEDWQELMDNFDEATLLHLEEFVAEAKS